MPKPSLLLIALFLAGIAASSCDSPGPPAAATEAEDDHQAPEGHADEVVITAEAIERYGIVCASAQLWMLRPTFTAPARVAFNAESIAHIGSPLSGRIVALPARLGDRVQAGDALAMIESAELGQAQAEYFQLRIAADSSAPAVELARGAWERAKALNEASQGISITEVQRRESEFRVAAASARLAQAAVVAAENRLQLLGMHPEAIAALAASGELAPRFTITAPITGSIVEREATLGELVGPDRESLMVLADTTRLWILASVPEAHVSDVAIGGAAWVAPGPEVGLRYQGVIAYVSPRVDPSTRTAQARIEIPSESLPLRAGMFAEVEIVAAQAPEAAPAIAVPQEAVQTVEGAPAVFVPVEGEPNTFAKRAVSIGRTIGGLVPIHSGLVEGELFVATGSFILKAELGKAGAEHAH